ncbi:hypothetical protein [Desulfovibrio psychrotolerans]|nr:hypothetical protein [Desulfovibrio psychrotolerans]
MHTIITKTTAPMHVAIHHEGPPEHLRATLGCLPTAGYPHALSVADYSGNTAYALHLHELHTAGTIHNLQTADTPVAPAAALMDLLAAVEAPYSLILPSGIAFAEPGWLRQMLGDLLACNAPAMAGIPDYAGRLTSSPVPDPGTLHAMLCHPDHALLLTHGALERLDVYTRRGLDVLLPQGHPHSADIAAREVRMQRMRSML